jgi:hypothetical protein
VKSGGFDLRMSNCREGYVRRDFLNIICTQASKSPARIVRYFFSKLDTHRIVSSPRAALLCGDFLRGEEGTAGCRFKLAVDKGSSVRARRSLALGMPYESRVSHKGEARRYAYARRRRAAAGGATRSSCGGPHDRPPPEESGTEGFRLKYFVPDTSLGRSPRSASLTDPPQVVTHLSTGCLMQGAHGYRNGTLVIKAAP